MILHTHPQSIENGVNGRSTSGRSPLRLLLLLLLLAVGLLARGSSILPSLLLLALLAVSSSAVGSLSAGGSTRGSTVLVLSRLTVLTLLLLTVLTLLLLARSAVLALLALLSAVAYAKKRSAQFGPRASSEEQLNRIMLTLLARLLSVARSLLRGSCKTPRTSASVLSGLHCDDRAHLQDGRREPEEERRGERRTVVDLGERRSL